MTSFNEYLAHGNAWLFIPAAVVLGALHGLEPGHSKTMMAAFIVAIRGTVAQAVLLGVSATISHTAIIWVLAFIGLRYAGQFDVETTEPYFQVATGVIVMAMAMWMYFRIRREQRAAMGHHHDHDHDHHHDHSHQHDHDHGHDHHHHDHHDDQPHGSHGGPLLQTGANEQMEISVFETGVPPCFRLYFYSPNGGPLKPPPANSVQLETTRPDGSRQLFEFVAKEDFLESTSDIPEPHEFKVTVKQAGGTHDIQFVEHDHHHHAHENESDEYEDEHQREHAADLEKRFANRHVTTGQLIVFGLTGGLLPCPSAFAVLLVCLQIKKFALGFAIVLAFSLGLAITLVSVGTLAALSVKHATARFKGLDKYARKMPYVSSGVMACIGLLVAFQGVKHLLH